MDIIGHENIINYFSQVLKDGKLAHAYLFIGPPQVGKTTVATWLASRLLGPEIFARPHPDFDWLKKVDLKKNIPIGEVRRLRLKLKQKPFLGKYKVVLIEAAEYLSLDAVNALLKTLEEPSGQTLIILTSARWQLLPATITSRCQVIKFSRVGRLKLEQALKAQNIRNFKILAGQAAGRPGQALGWAKQTEEFNSRTVQGKDLFKLLQSSLNTRWQYVESVLSQVEGQLVQARQAERLLLIWQELVRDIMLSQLGLDDKITNGWALSEIKKLNQSLSLRQILIWQQQFSLGLQLLRANASPKLVLENNLMTLADE
jgi:DNA polymerase III subunit delta'